MPRDLNGTYTLPVGNPVVTGTVVSADWANSTLPDLGGALSDSLSRSGAGGMTAALKLTAGSALAPALYFASVSDTGVFYDGLTPLLGVSFAGNLVGQFDAAGFKALGLGVTNEYDLPAVDGLAENFLMTDGAGNVTFTDRGMLSLETETVTLAGAQTTVPFLLSGTLAYYHVVGLSADNGLISEGVDYTVTDATHIELLGTYPATTQIVKFLYHTEAIDVSNAVADAEAAAAAAAVSEANADADATQTALDRVQTGLDATATAADRVQTGIDATATAADRVQTGLDRIQTGLDATQTAADRVQTGNDAASAGASEGNASDSATLAEDWAESPTAPGAVGTKSSKTWAGEAEASASSIDAVNLKSGRKNLIINGNFDIWQRGTILTNAVQYTADRWQVTFGFGGVDVTASRIATDGTEPFKADYYARVTTSAATGGAQRIRQVLEANGKNLAGQIFTASFYLKSSSARNVESVFMSGQTDIGIQILAVTTAWQKFTFTFTTLPGFSTTNPIAIDLYFTDGEVLNLDIAQVQLEKGSIATNFEYRHIAEELALCQRYYQVATHASGVIHDATRVWFTVNFGTAMRAPPTATLLNDAPVVQSGNVQSTGSSSSISSLLADPGGATIRLTGFTGLMPGQGAVTIAFAAAFESEL